MSTRKVIVFGATGAVGGAAALEAHNRGAKVYLAMRDTKKSTQNLPDSLERIQADLSDPASIEKAVQETGATAAFVYMVHGADMSVTAAAFKKSGIAHVVLLSSFTVYPDLETALEDTHISKVHAAAEIAFTDAGVKFTALRPMYFASNLLHDKRFLDLGTAYLYRTDAVDDYIAPEDIGAVGGVKLLSDEAEIIPICGPNLLTREQAWTILGKEFGKDLEIKQVSGEEYVQAAKSSGQPEAIAKVLMKYMDRSKEERYPDALYKTASSNVKRYTGREPLGWGEWVKKHKSEIA